MSSADRRRDRRVPLELPAAVMSASGPIFGEVRDVSVSGVQLYVLASGFGLSGAPTLLEAALAVREALDARFTVTLDRDHVGEIHRVAGLARLVLPSHAPGCIELGCEFDEPLSDEEMARLTGNVSDTASADAEVEPHTPSTVVDTPEEETTPAGTLPPSDAAAMLRGRATSSYRVQITSNEDDGAPPLNCRVRGLNLEGLRVRITGASMDTTDATQAAVAFMERYGDRVKLKITDGSKHLWTGQAQVFGLEVKLTRPDELLVALGYERSLRPAEMDRMGLSSRVA